MPHVDKTGDFDAYWRLKTYKHTGAAALLRDLNQNGHKLNKRILKAELVTLQQRDDRNLIRYDGCSDSELQSFVATRQLRSLIDRKSMIQTLRDADEAPKFHRFLDLPPELRILVCDHYMLWLKPILRCPTIPPLGRLNYRMRQEMAPAFFGSKRFTLRFQREGPWPPVKGSTRLVLDPLFQLWLYTLRPEHVAAIHHISIEAWLSYIWTLSVDISPQAASYQVHAGGQSLSDQDSRTRWAQIYLETIERFEREVKILFQTVCVRPTGKKLRIDDMWALRKAMERALWE